MENPATIDTPRICSLLGLPPDSDAATIEARFTEIASASPVDSGRVAQLEAELAQANAQLAVFSDREKADKQTKAEAEVGTLLEEYKAVIATPEAMDAIRSTLLNDRELGMKILAGFKKPAPAVPAPNPAKEETPPEPLHDPKAGDAIAPSEEAIARAITAEVKRLQGINPKGAYPALQTQAEKTIRAKVANNEAL